MSKQSSLMEAAKQNKKKAGGILLGAPGVICEFCDLGRFL